MVSVPAVGVSRAIHGLPANADAGYSTPNTDALDQATATGGNGGAGGMGGMAGMGRELGNGGNGGNGGGATARAATSIVSGAGEADAYSYGGNGGAVGCGAGGSSGECVYPDVICGGSGGAANSSAQTTVISGAAAANAYSTGGNGSNETFGALFNGVSGAGGAATSTAKASGSTSVSSSATAVGGSGGCCESDVYSGGDASASSAATGNGAGGVSSSATATGGVGGWDGNFFSGNGGRGAAVSTAMSSGSGDVTSTATANGGSVGIFPGSAPSFGSGARRQRHQHGDVERLRRRVIVGDRGRRRRWRRQWRRRQRHEHGDVHRFGQRVIVRRRDRRRGRLPGSGAANAESTAENASGTVATTARSPAAGSSIEGYGAASAMTMASIGAGDPGPVSLAAGQSVSNASLTPGGPTIGVGAMSADYGGWGETLTYQTVADFTFTTTAPEELYLTLLDNNFSGVGFRQFGVADRRQRTRFRLFVYLP